MNTARTRADKRSAGARTLKSRTDLSPERVRSICARLANNQRVRRALPSMGRLHIDRQLPFLCVYRQPTDSADAGTERLVQGEASYLVASGTSAMQPSLQSLVHELVRTLQPAFGAFLIIELWAGRDGGAANDPARPTVLPTFTIHAPAAQQLTRTVEALEKRLKRVKVLKQGVEVVVERDDRAYPPDMGPLLSEEQAAQLNCSVIGLAVPPVYRRPNSPAEFPMLARALRRQISLALRQCYFEFVRSRTTQRPAHYHSLGRRAVVKAVWDIDQRLAQVSNGFDYLLQLTPVNANSAWTQFQRDRFDRAPEFHYRPLPVDPSLLKRELYKIPFERVEDPALHRLFLQKQEELELKLTMLRDRDTPRFIHESLQLFGGAEDVLLEQAKELCRQLPPTVEPDHRPMVDATAFALRARAEFDFYRGLSPEFSATALVTPDVSGLIVSRGKLLINSELRLSPSRVEALLAHEVGTHLVTYHNGRMQPFKQLYSGLAGYEELQEGLAVLAEHLVDGLSPSRLRQLAARVIAVRQLTEGASFVETFRLLRRDFGFKERAAYGVTMRVYRGGGLTKDVVYLRGLEAMLRHVQSGGDLQLLLVGKVAAEHIPIIKELRYRKVLHPPSIVPRYLQTAAATERLERLRGGSASVGDLVSDSKQADL